MSAAPPALAPAPDGADLVVAVACTAHPRQLEGERHPVVIRSDWSVTTVHELDSERVARSLGGWSSCLYFAETIVPAYRHSLRIMRDPTSLSRNAVGDWMNTSPPFCVGGHRRSTLREAVRHEIEGTHLAGLFASDQWRFDADALEFAGHHQFDELIGVAGPAWAARADARIVHLGIDGYARLWREGMLPEHAEALAARTPRTAWPLSVGFLLDRYYEQLDPPRRRWVE